MAGTCEDLAKLSLPHGMIVSARAEAEGRPLAGVPPAIKDLPAFCRVEAVLSPTADSAIRVEIWMPAEKWNGKFEGTGSGGFAGSIQYWGLAEGLRRGYAYCKHRHGNGTLDRA